MGAGGEGAGSHKKETMKQVKRKRLPPGLQKISIVCDKAVKRLQDEGHSFEDSENAVLEVLIENKSAIEKKQYSSVIACIEIIFLHN